MNTYLINQKNKILELARELYNKQEISEDKLQETYYYNFKK